MTRSIWKGPFVDITLIKKAEKQNYNYLLKSIERGEQGLSEVPATPMSLREAEQEQQLYYYNGDDSDVPE